MLGKPLWAIFRKTCCSVCHVISLLFGKTRDWLTGDDVSVTAFFVWYLTSNLQSTNPHYWQRGQVCKAGTGIAEDVSSENAFNDLPGRWKHVTSFVNCKERRDWLTGYDVRGRVLLSRPVGWCFKSREAWTSALWRWNSWPVWSRFFFSAGCTLKPVSWPSTALTTDTSAGSIRVGLRVSSEENWRIHLLLLMKKY